MDLARAVQNSIEMDATHKARMEQCRERLYPRLAAKGLRAVHADPYGNCQFIALVQTAGLDMHYTQLRKEIVDYMESFPSFFGDSFGGFDQYGEYLQGMREGAWGDHFTLVAAAHLLLRPIIVTTDALSDASATMTISPPEH
eukprot:6804372-Karenia_brevis.AAC.1